MRSLRRRALRAIAVWVLRPWAIAPNSAQKSAIAPCAASFEHRCREAVLNLSKAILKEIAIGLDRIQLPQKNRLKGNSRLLIVIVMLQSLASFISFSTVLLVRRVESPIDLSRRVMW